MRKLSSFVALVTVAALSMPVQASAKDGDPVGSSPESSTTQPFEAQPPVTASRSSRAALDYAEELLERALDAVSKSTITPSRKSELSAALRQLIDRVDAKQLPEKAEMESVLGQVANALAAQTAAPTTRASDDSGKGSDNSGKGSDSSGKGSDSSGRGSGSSGKGSGSSGRGPVTSSPTPPPNAMPLSQILRDAMAKVAASKLDATTKASLTKSLQSVIDQTTAGQMPPTPEIEKTLRQVASALGLKDPTKLSEPDNSKHDGTDDNMDDNTDEEDGPDLTEPGDDSTPPVADPADPLLTGAAPSRGSSQQRSPEKSRADLVEKLQEVLDKVAVMSTSPEIESAKTLITALLTRIQAGEIIPQGEVRGALDRVKTIAFARLGRENRHDEAEPAEAPSQENITQRMNGSIDEALRQLGALTTPDADIAVSAMAAIKDKIASGAVVTKDEFEQAMRLARAALGTKPGARASVTLAGVLSQLENSNVSAEAKAAIMEVITKALNQAQQNPDADPTEAVKAALEQARAARIAAAVERLSAITADLTADAEAASSIESLLILADVVAVLNPSDGSTPTRDQLHEARSTLEQVLTILHPELSEDASAADTTEPDTTEPSTTEP